MDKLLLKGMVYMKRVLSVALVLFFIYSCNPKGTFPPAGSYSGVILVTENGKVEGYTKEMVEQLQHVLDYYNKQEYQFFVKVISIYDFEKEPPAKNVVLLGLPTQGKIGKYIQNFIGPGGVRSVLEGKLNIFKKLNYPVEGQLTMIVTASSPDYLSKVIREKGEVIRETIEEANRERLRKYRNFRVREIVRYAYEHVPYYHEKFNELKVKPSDLR